MRVEKKIYDKNYGEKIRERIAGKTDLQLGKNGLSKSFIKEVRRRLEKNGVVKIRVLKNFIRVNKDIDRREVAEKVAKIVGAKLLEVRGYTFILVKDKVKDRG